MNLLIRQHRTYEQVFYDNELHFTDIVKIEMSKVLPGFAILGFSPFIIGDEGTRRRPDLALVARNYSMWVVVEVELENHSLDHHVVPQIQAFVSGRYGESHADLLYERDPSLSQDRLRELVKFVPPIVSVIVNSRSVLNDGWEVLESEHSAQLTFLESYRSQDGDVIVSVSGYLPAPQPRPIARLRKQEMMNALFCSRPTDIPAALGDSIRMYWGERPHVWQILRTMDSVVLLAPGGFTVRPDRNYEVLQTDDGRFRLQEM
jgi:hypothetical protein